LVSGIGSWCAGENLTFVDFLVWELLDHHRLLVPGCLDGFDALQQFLVKFEDLENIGKYLSDPRYKQFPIWSCRAKYGYFPL
jgi:glutathione S-transferase